MPGRGKKPTKVRVISNPRKTRRGWLSLEREAAFLTFFSAAHAEHFYLTGRDEALSMLAAAVHTRRRNGDRQPSQGCRTFKSFREMSVAQLRQG